MRLLSSMAVRSNPLRASILAFQSALALALPIAFAAQPSAHAVSFRFDFSNNASEEFKSATQQAAKAWSSLLTDDVIIDLRVEYHDFSSASDSVLGVSQPAVLEVSYKNYVDALFKDVVSNNDLTAISNLQLSAQGREAIQGFRAGSLSANRVLLNSDAFSFLTNGNLDHGSAVPSIVLDNDRDLNNTQVRLTRAQAKALNLLSSDQRELDAIIRINSNTLWDFNPEDGIAGDRYDMSSVMQHEIGHALGVASGVDVLDLLANSQHAPEIDHALFSYATPMDLYRYSSQSAQAGVIDLALGNGEKYFSLDGGQTVVTDKMGRTAYFSTGSSLSGGDGYQNGHWKAATAGKTLGIINPALKQGQSNAISQLDLTLLDVMGWDLEDRMSSKAAAVDVDWNTLAHQLSLDREATVEQAISQWQSQVPELARAMEDASVEIDLAFRQQLQALFDQLEGKLAILKKEGDRDPAYRKFYAEVAQASAERNQALSELPRVLFETDKVVREWLSLSSDDLAEKMRKATRIEISRLFSLVKAAAAEHTDWEPKLAAALSQTANEPNELVETLLETNGLVHPVGFDDFPNWDFWFQFAEEGSPPLRQPVGDRTRLASAISPDVSQLTTTLETTEVPEPPMLLALCGAVLAGASMTRRNQSGCSAPISSVKG